MDPISILIMIVTTILSNPAIQQWLLDLVKKLFDKIFHRNGLKLALPAEGGTKEQVRAAVAKSYDAAINEIGMFAIGHRLAVRWAKRFSLRHTDLIWDHMYGAKRGTMPTGVSLTAEDKAELGECGAAATRDVMAH